MATGTLSEASQLVQSVLFNVLENRHRLAAKDIHAARNKVHILMHQVRAGDEQAVEELRKMAAGMDQEAQ